MIPKKAGTVTQVFDVDGHFNSYPSAMSQTMAGKAGGSTSDGLKVDVFGYDIRCHESP